jgi:ATP-dependent Clp protease ATP-binding subunit ClpA
MGGSDKENYEDAKKKVMESLKEYFRPEFLNRLDDILIFDILSSENIRKIVDIQVNHVRERLKTKEIELVISESALDYLGREGYNPQYGARPLKRLIQNKILNPVANLIITQGVAKGGLINIDVKNNELTFDVKKGRKGKIIGAEFMQKVAQEVKK